jgi:hypothetical protein
MSAEYGRYTLQQAIPAFPFPLPQVPATGIRRGIRLFSTRVIDPPGKSFHQKYSLVKENRCGSEDASARMEPEDR